jgi:hypothetical protein
MRFLTALLLTLFFVLIQQPLSGGDKKVAPTNLGKVNTKADEDDPFLLSSQVLLYASNQSGNWAIMRSDRKAGKWAAGKAIPSLKSKEADYRSPFVARDGKLYFASNKVPDKKLADLKNFDIWVSTGGREPLPLLGEGISTQEDELHPWVTPAGKEFYFSRKTKEGWVLFVARGPNPGPISNPKPVGFKPGFHHATLSASGLIMFLQGPVEKHRNGLFRSKRTKVGAAWSKPAPLTMLNHPEGEKGDASPCLSGDGKHLYFASDRPGGMGGLDLWVVEVAELKVK